MKILNYVEAYIRKAHGQSGFKIGPYRVQASRWPWQGYGWFPHKSKNTKLCAPLNPFGSRFGGGWNYKLGISVGGSTVYIDLLFGSLRIVKEGR